jgi:hypothetical protein
MGLEAAVRCLMPHSTAHLSACATSTTCRCLPPAEASPQATRLGRTHIHNLASTFLYLFCTCGSKRQATLQKPAQRWRAAEIPKGTQGSLGSRDAGEVFPPSKTHLREKARANKLRWQQLEGEGFRTPPHSYRGKGDAASCSRPGSGQAGKDKVSKENQAT